MWASACETLPALHPPCGESPTTQSLCRYQPFFPLAQLCCPKGVPIPSGTWDLVFLFGITDKPGAKIGTILSGSKDHRIAGMWGVIQKPSALRNLCSEEAKPISLPIHPATFDWALTVTLPKCEEPRAQAGTEQMWTPPPPPHYPQEAWILFGHDEEFSQPASAGTYNKYVEEAEIAHSRWQNRGWRREIWLGDNWKPVLEPGLRSHSFFCPPPTLPNSYTSLTSSKLLHVSDPQFPLL